MSQNCSACHPLDYSLVNSPFLNRQGWETEVNFKVYGAPIETAAAKIIIDYLAKNYGTGSQIRVRAQLDRPGAASWAWPTAFAAALRGRQKEAASPRWVDRRHNGSHGSCLLFPPQNGH